MQKKFLSVVSLVLALSMMLAGCGEKAEVSESSVPEETAPSEEVSEEVSEEAAVPSEEAPEEENKTSEVVIYIGTNVNEPLFNEYPVEVPENYTPDDIIKAMSDLTGWDLTLADTVTTGKGGMTVCFSKESALFVGPPSPQKDEFFVYDAESLCMMILDSIQETLRRTYVLEPGDPESLDIYYCMEGDEPLYIPNTGMTFPMDEPYSWDKMTIKQ